MADIVKEKIQFNSPSTISVTDSGTPETFPLHWHNAAEFVLALKNNCRYTVNDNVFDLKKGDILLIWPQQIHSTLKIPKDGAVFIQFPSSIIENNLDLVSIQRFLYACNHISLSKRAELADLIGKKIFEIQKIHNSSDPLSETGCKLCIYEILLETGRHVLLDNKNIHDDASGAGWNYIHKACIFISENSSEDITQSDVAGHVGLSTFYFSKLFKQYMHISFPAYLSNIRVKSAAGLLLNKDLSITECAFMSGFQSTTAFNRAFRDITGYSPRQYRKLYR